jgi:hypothetical protein
LSSERRSPSQLPKGAISRLPDPMGGRAVMAPTYARPLEVRRHAAPGATTRSKSALQAGHDRRSELYAVSWDSSDVVVRTR